MENTEKTKKPVEEIGKQKFLGLVLRDDSRRRHGKGTHIYCYLIEEGAYCFITDWQCDYDLSESISPYNGKMVHDITISNHALQNMRYRRSWCPELYFPKYISYYQLHKQLLRKRLSRYLEIHKLNEKYNPKKLSFTLKNMKRFLGVPNIKTSDQCLCCGNNLVDIKKLVCDVCSESLVEEVELSGVSDYAKYLPKGLITDPLEIRFEDIGIKYKNRRYKWFEKYSKKNVIITKSTKGHISMTDEEMKNRVSKVLIIDELTPEQEEIKALAEAIEKPYLESFYDEKKIHAFIKPSLMVLNIGKKDNSNPFKDVRKKRDKEMILTDLFQRRLFYTNVSYWVHTDPSKRTESLMNPTAKDAMVEAKRLQTLLELRKKYGFRKTGTTKQYEKKDPTLESFKEMTASEIIAVTSSLIFNELSNHIDNEFQTRSDQAYREKRHWSEEFTEVELENSSAAIQWIYGYYKTAKPIHDLILKILPERKRKTKPKPKSKTNTRSKMVIVDVKEEK